MSSRPARSTLGTSTLGTLTLGTLTRKRTHAPSRRARARRFAALSRLEPLESRQLLAGTGLLGTYYNQIDFTDQAVVRVDPVVHFNLFPPETPHPNIQPDNYSAIWSGHVQPPTSEPYQFHTISDDGVRLYLDKNQDGVFGGDEMIIDNFTFHGPMHDSSVQIDLTAGQQYAIRMEWFQGGGGATAQLRWSTPTTIENTIPQQSLYPDAEPPPETIPNAPSGLTAAIDNFGRVRLNWSDNSNNENNFVVERSLTGDPNSYHTVGTQPRGATAFLDNNVSPNTTYFYRVAAGNGAGQSDYSNVVSITTPDTPPPPPPGDNGLLAQYFNEIDFTNLAVTRVDPTVNFEGFGPHTPDPAIETDNYSAIWSGRVQAQFTEEYVFHTISDDGVRLYLDINQDGSFGGDELIIDNFTFHGAVRDSSAPLPLTAGQQYLIRMDWFQGGGGAIAKLLWSSPSTPEDIIPQSQLFPAAPPPESVPNAPSNLWADFHDSPHVHLFWFDNSDNERGFVIERSPTGQEGTFFEIGRSPPSFANFFDGTTQAQTTYYYRVAAFNGAGVSPYSEILQLTTPAAPTLPAAPSNLTAAVDAANDVQLSWTDNATDAFVFHIDRSTTGNPGSFREIGSSPTPNFTDTTAVNGTTYYYQVRARNQAGSSAPSNTATVTIPGDPPPTGSGTGLLGTYYNNMDFTDFVLARVDSTIDFEWHPPQTPDPAIGIDNYSVIWTGEIEAMFSEQYQFHTHSDDGVRLWLDLNLDGAFGPDELLIDHFDLHPPMHDFSFPVMLEAGQRYGVRMEYFQGPGFAVAELYWSSPSTADEIIPQSQLYPGDNHPGDLVASIGGVPANAREGSPITLTAHTNRPPTEVEILWTVTRSGQTYATGGGRTFTFTPDDDASYEIALTIEAADQTAAANAHIEVANVAPKLTFTGAPSTDEGAQYTLNLSSTDPGADTISHWVINWGDGNTETIPGNPSSVTHAYADNGSYTITATATDEDGTWTARGSGGGAGGGGGGPDRYVLTSGIGSWHHAQAEAVELGGHLVAINDAQEQALIESLFLEGQLREAFWIGLTDSDEFTTEGQYVWVNGDPVTYTNWNLETGEPNNYWGPGSEDFGVINFQYWFGQPGRLGSWNDSDETQWAFRGIVELGGPAGHTVTVRNVSPTATVSNPSTAVRGQAVTFTAAIADPGSADTHTVHWDFGDGTSLPSRLSTDEGALTPSHTYSATGTYTVTLTVTDDDGGERFTQTQIEIKAVDLQPDLSDPGNTLLAIGGSTAADNINVTTAGGQLVVTIDGQSAGSFPAVGKILIFGQSGDDKFIIDGTVNTPAEIYAGDGNDQVHGGAAGDILVGGNGDDHFTGGSGRDLIIGGDGSDRLIGNGGEDIVVSAITSFDANPAALGAILAEWSRTDITADQRKLHLTAGGGLNGPHVFNSSTVIDDDDSDDVNGNENQDWHVDTAAAPTPKPLIPRPPTFAQRRIAPRARPTLVTRAATR